MFIMKFMFALNGQKLHSTISFTAPCVDGVGSKRNVVELCTLRPCSNSVRGAELENLLEAQASQRVGLGFCNFLRAELPRYDENVKCGRREELLR